MIENQQLPGVLWDLNQIAFIDPTESEDVQDAKLKAFKTTMNKVEGYQDNPCILISTVHSIQTGVSLPPADTVVFLDSDYVPASIQQAGGRVSRNRIVQKAPFTEFYRFVGHAPWMPLSLYQAQRNVALSTIQDAILAKGDGQQLASILV